ncbi:MAG: general secretion pathway protein GspB [Steroidobacteraceae bacterium]
MSFILDALKKSESERQRQAGPGLMEVRIAPPRNRLPVWAILVGALLLLNILVLGAVLVYRETITPEAAAVTTPVPVVVATTAPVIAPPALVVPPPPQTEPLAQMQSDPQLEAGVQEYANPADFVPALPAGSSPLPIRELPEETNLPSRDDLVSGGVQLPALHLTFHVYSPQPAERYVLINTSRLREGDSMPDGMRVERITESGVVLSWRGQRFRLKQGD